MSSIERASELIVTHCYAGTHLSVAADTLRMEDKQAQRVVSNWRRCLQGLYSSSGGWGLDYSRRLWTAVRERLAQFPTLEQLGGAPAEWTDTAKRGRDAQDQLVSAPTPASVTLFTDDDARATATPAEDRIAAAMERIADAVEGLYSEARQQRAIHAKVGGNGHVASESLTVVSATAGAVWEA